MLASPLALAHRPQVADEFLEIPDPTISYVIGGDFVDGVEVFTIELVYEEPFALPMELMVPRRGDPDAHRPAFAVVGPGLPAPTAEQLDWLPKEVPEGHGVFIDRNDDAEREVYFETIMRRTLWTTGSTAIHLPAADTYEIWIWSPDFTVGEFWFGFGVEEDFTGDAWSPVFSDWGLFAW